MNLISYAKCSYYIFKNTELNHLDGVKRMMHGSLFFSSIPINSIYFLIVQVSNEMGQLVLNQGRD